MKSVADLGMKCQCKNAECRMQNSRHHFLFQTYATNLYTQTWEITQGRIRHRRHYGSIFTRLSPFSCMSVCHTILRLYQLYTTRPPGPSPRTTAFLRQRPRRPHDDFALAESPEINTHADYIVQACICGLVEE